MVQMNKKALEDYDTLEWDAAKKTLLDALMAGKKAGLDNHPVMARTYVHLGAVYLTGFKDRQKALSSFQRALEIDPGIQLSKGISTPDVQACSRRPSGEGRRAAPAGGGGEESRSAAGQAPARVQSWRTSARSRPSPRRFPARRQEEEEGAGERRDRSRRSRPASPRSTVPPPRRR